MMETVSTCRPAITYYYTCFADLTPYLNKKKKYTFPNCLMVHIPYKCNRLDYCIHKTGKKVG